MVGNKVLIFFRALVWLSCGENRNKLQKVKSVYDYGGFKLCWEMAEIRFSRACRKYVSAKNQLTKLQAVSIFSKCSDLPKISIVVPVYKVDKKWLEKCIESVLTQYYDNWELFLIDDASQSMEAEELMKFYEQGDSRIHCVFLNQNKGISGATNIGIDMASGEFVGFLDHDDELTPDALTWIVWSLNQNPKAQWLYSDEDLISTEGKCYNPHYKSDFSPEHLLSHMFTCHFSVYSRKLLLDVGGIREGYDGAQDHDLALRLSEVVNLEEVVHIPRVLYHWRAVPSSTASNIQAKPKAPMAGRKAVSDALRRRQVKGVIKSHPLCQTLYQITLQAQVFPKVSIVIPTRNRKKLLKKCVESIEKYTKYPNYEIIIIDNQSDEDETLFFLEQQEKTNRARILRYADSFNFSEMNNIAVSQSDAELIVFMNNDIEIITEAWLDQLVATIQMDKKIGVVGTLLLYDDGTVQHGGIVLGINGFTGHSHQFMNGKSPGYNCRLYSLQELSAVTAALKIVTRKAFIEVGGFDSDRYPVIGNDVDLCLRMRKSGYRCLYNPMVKAIHHETKSRIVNKYDYAAKGKLKRDYAKLFQRDPFYNPNLSLSNGQFIGYREFPVWEQIPELRT